MPTETLEIHGALSGKMQSASRRRRALARGPRVLWKKSAAWFKALLKSVARRLWKPFTIFRFAGVPVQVHSTFLIYPVGFIFWQTWAEGGSSELPLMSALIALLCFSLFVHEFAHILVARCFGIGTESMIFHPFGAVACLAEIPAGRREFWIALAGPLSSFALAGGLWWLKPHLLHWVSATLLHDHFRPSWYYDLRRLVGVGIGLNLFVAIFNLLPCYPMDGGRILRSLLACVIAKTKRCTQGAALLLATRITVRWVARLLVLGSVLVTIFYTRQWLGLIMFPLLLFVGELEYAMLREKFGERETNLARFDRGLKSSRRFRAQSASLEIALRRRELRTRFPVRAKFPVDAPFPPSLASPPAS